jgi:hypothetical protein
MDDLKSQEGLSVDAGKVIEESTLLKDEDVLYQTENQSVDLASVQTPVGPVDTERAAACEASTSEGSESAYTVEKTLETPSVGSKVPDSNSEPSTVAPGVGFENDGDKEQHPPQPGKGLVRKVSGSTRTASKRKPPSDQKGSPSGPIPLQTDRASTDHNEETVPRSPERPRIEYNTLIQVR